jgi:hypothetical protein
MNATLDISKILTVITEEGKFGHVYSTKLGAFESEIVKFDAVDLKGHISGSKYNKYLNIAISCGFKLESVSWKHEEEDGYVRFLIHLKR